MFEANEILLELLSKNKFTEVEKNRILQYRKVYSNIVNYLMQRFNNLHIEVLGDYEGSLFQLMFAEKLIGWCWQTTESAIVFLNDNDYIERGTLFIDERTPKYYHSWICFNYYDVDYVLDPSLSLLCKKEDYYKMFNPNIIGKVSAKLVKDELIRQITSVKEEKKSKEQISFFEKTTPEGLLGELIIIALVLSVKALFIAVISIPKSLLLHKTSTATAPTFSIYTLYSGK